MKTAPDIGATTSSVVEGGVVAVTLRGIPHTPVEGLVYQALPNRIYGAFVSTLRRCYAKCLLSRTQIVGWLGAKMDIRQEVRGQESIARYTLASIYLSFLCGRLRGLCRDDCHSGCCSSSHTTQDYLRDCLSWIHPCGLRTASCWGSGGMLPRQAYELIFAPICDFRWKGKRKGIRLSNGLMQVGEASDRKWKGVPILSFLSDKPRKSGHYQKRILHRFLQSPLRTSKFLVLAY